MQHTSGFSSGSGEVGALIQNHDWASSPLGSPASWPQPFKVVADLILHSKTPMFLVWGSELRFFYNDAYLDILGIKHPAALGRPFAEVWPEIWNEVHPLLKRTLAGEALYFEHQPFTLQRKGYKEKAWFSFSYTPIRDEAGQIAGVYCSLFETTEQVHKEKERLEETQRLYRLFEQSPGFIGVTRGPEHIYELINKATLQLVGHRDLVGKPVREALPELKGQGYYELLDQVYTTGEPYVGRRMPAILQREPGAAPEERFVDFVFQPIVDADGRISGVFIQGHDVTDHKNTEDELRASEGQALETARLAEFERRRLDAVLEAAPVGIIYGEPDGRLIMANSDIKRVWGEYTLSRNVDEYVEWKGWWADGSKRHGEPVNPHEWPMARALQGEDVLGDIIEIEPFCSPGIRKTVVLRAVPIRDASSRLAGGVVAQMDITEQVKAETALRESKAHLQSIFEQTAAGIYETDLTGCVIRANKRYCQIVGRSYEEVIGQFMQDLTHPDDLPRNMEFFKNLGVAGEAFEVEKRYLRPDGTSVWVSNTVTLIDKEGDKSMGSILAVVLDISDRKEAEEALKQADRRKDEFLAMLAHELRNPLAPICTAAQILKISSKDQKRIQQASEIIARQVKHMTELVDDLLDVSRVTRGLVELEKSDVDIKAVINSAAEQARPLIEARHHELNMYVASEPAVVLGDRTRLVQVITNLLNNAAKYTPQQGRITLSVEVQEAQVRISVSDNGSGIEPSLLPNIFDLFTQGTRTSDRSQGGLGLGLALVKTIIGLHDGHVEAHSEGLGKGSMFTVAMTLVKNVEAVHQKTDDGNLPRDALRSVRIMIVDDNLDAAETLATLLEAKGHQITVQSDPKSALKYALQHPPEVFILDIGLPEMDGYELARRLRGCPETANACFIALTGYGQAHDRVLSRSAGFDHHFIKPMDTDQLVRIVAELD